MVNLDTGAERTATADAQGRYTITQVPPGIYKVTAKARIRRSDLTRSSCW